MQHVVYVAPFFGEATLHFIRALSQLEGARFGLISQAPTSALPESLRRGIDAHYQVENGTDAAQIADAARRIGKNWGRLDRLFATLEHIQEQVARAREWLSLPGMSEAVSRNFRDKAEMKSALRAAGLPCARHARVTCAADAARFVQAVGFPIILKPPAEAGAVGTYRVETPELLARLISQIAPSPERPLVAEEFIRGTESSFETVMIAGQPVWHSGVHYRPGCLEVVETPWIQWTTLLPRERITPHFESFRETNVRALRALGMTHGISHMEWFRRADGSVAISEVGARPPGAQIMPALCLAHDADMFTHWAQLAVFDRFEPPPRRHAVAVAFLRAQGRGRVIRTIHGLDAAQRAVGHLVVSSRLPRIGQSPSSSYEGDGVVFLRHEDTDVVRRAVDHIIKNVRVELG